MKLPHLKYIQSLIAGKMLPDDILVEMNRWSLPFPAQEMNEIYEDIRKKDPKFFSTKSKTQIDRYVIDNLEITPMVTYKFDYGAAVNLNGIEEAFKLLENNNIRTMLYVMILSGMYMEDIELTLNEKFDDLNATSESISMFRHYFFNLKDFTFKEKQELERGFAQDVGSRRMFKIALKGDRGYTLWKLNAAPKRSMSSMLKEMFDDSFYLFKEKSKMDADTATRFGALALKLSDKLDKMEDTKNKADNIFADLKFEEPDPKKVNKDMEIFNPPTSDELGVDVTPTFKEDEEASIPEAPSFKPPINIDDME